MNVNLRDIVSVCFCSKVMYYTIKFVLTSSILLATGYLNARL